MSAPSKGGPSPAAAVSTAPAATIEGPLRPPSAGSELLGEIIGNTRIARDHQQRETFEKGLFELARQLETGGLHPIYGGDLDGLINAAIGEIDRKLSHQVDEILHHPKFQKLEATWRSLFRVVEESYNRADNREEIQIKVLNANRRDLERDLKVGVKKSPYKTGLFEKVYTSTFNTLGGHPFAALIGDLEFSHTNRDVDLLEKISGVAAMAHAPFIAAASPAMFGWAQFTQIPTAGDIENLFNLPEYDAWRAFRRKPDSRYVGLCLPQVLTRLPYGEKDGQPVETFDYQEGVDGRDHGKYLWGNTAYALAGRLLEAFTLDGWCVAVIGPKGGGQVDDLPLHAFQTGEGDVAIKSPTEVQLSDDREFALTKLGFIPLVQRKHDRCAVFFGAPTCHEPARYTSDGGNANAYLGSQLPYMMAASRIAHYLKVIGREEIGSTLTVTQIRNHLQEWINQYVIDQDDATEDQRRRKPLRNALIEVTEIPGRPGFYQAKAFIRPHFKLEGLGAEVSLVAELPRRLSS
jgi:type VI secretion system protein ImpC